MRMTWFCKLSLHLLYRALYKLLNYTNEWDLDVNVPKIKVVILRNWGKIAKAYNGQILEVVNTFNYLGMLFNFNG